MNKEEINLLNIQLFLNYYKKDITERYAKCIDNIVLDNDILYTDERLWITTLEKHIELQQENNQLKEQLEKKYEKTGTLTTEILYEENTKLQSVLKELRSWLEDWLKIIEKQYDKLKEPVRKSFFKVTIDTLKEVLSKLNELEGKNE